MSPLTVVLIALPQECFGRILWTDKLPIAFIPALIDRREYMESSLTY